jgi:hypothetical protein
MRKQAPIPINSHKQVLLEAHQENEHLLFNIILRLAKIKTQKLYVLQRNQKKLMKDGGFTYYIKQEKILQTTATTFCCTMKKGPARNYL